MDELIMKYKSYLRYEKNYSLHTEISYSNDLYQFVDYLRLNNLCLGIEFIDSDIIRNWIMTLVSQGISSRSVNRKLSSLKSFFTYLLRCDIVKINPVKKISGPKVSKPLPIFVSDRDMDGLLDDYFEYLSDFEYFRDRVILELFYVTGMRRSELILLKDIDFDLDLQTILVNGKRNKQRVIPLSTFMQKLLIDYINCRNKNIESRCDRLFITNHGQALYPMLVYRIVTRNLRVIPTLTKINPHILRHSFATAMLNGGADINAVKDLLGHASLAATEIYTHTSFEELKKIYEKAHPRA